MLEKLRKECYRVSRLLDPLKDRDSARRAQKRIDAALNAARGHLDGEGYVKQLRQALDNAETILHNT